MQLMIIVGFSPLATIHSLIAATANTAMYQTIKKTYDTNGMTIPYDGGFDDFDHACASAELVTALNLQQGKMAGYSSSPTGFHPTYKSA